MVFSVVIDGVRNQFFPFFKKESIKNIADFSSYSEHTGGTAEIYLSKDKYYLLKLMRCKHKLKDGFFIWFYKVFLKKVTVIKLDAFREARGYKIANKANIKTPILYSWGVPSSFFNDFVSYFLIEYKSGSKPGSLYFKSLSFDGKKVFLSNLAGQLARLSRLGFSHRDLHLDNLLIEKNGNILWIDNHFKRLPLFKNRRIKQLDYSIRHILYLVENLDAKINFDKYRNDLLAFLDSPDKFDLPEIINL